MTQSEALDILKMGRNVFLTGAAGSGKTHVLNSYIKYLKSHAVDVAITASTGIAATHIGGQTIHSWSGLGVRSVLTEYDIEDLLERQYLYKRFERAKVLVIDEVSMLHSFRLDMIDWICRSMKRNHEPFGGMQIIVCGDFFQLPPVSREKIDESDNLDFAFKATSWKNAKFTICYINEQHRQKDKNYLSILNEVRSGKVSKKTIDLLLSRMNKDPEYGKEFTRLYTHNIDVDTVNKKHLDLIDTTSKSYEMIGKGSQSLIETLKKSCLSPQVLELKVGARVMFTKNHPEGVYVNGTLGVVQAFNSYGEPVVLTNSGMTFAVKPDSWKIEEEGKVKAEVSQLPLRLAWAITVHKSQGMSLDSVEMDLSKSFVKGMGYVALSRVRSLDGIKLLGLNDMALHVEEEILEKDYEFREMSDEAQTKLSKMEREDILEIQKEWIKSIEPEEKVRIRKKEKEQNKELKRSTEEITKTFLEEEVPLSLIAESRGVKQETIVSHIEKLLELKKCPDISYLKKELKQSELRDIESAIKKTGGQTLSSVYNFLLAQKKKPNYLKIRLARLFIS